MVSLRFNNNYNNYYYNYNNNNKINKIINNFNNNYNNNNFIIFNYYYNYNNNLHHSSIHPIHSQEILRLEDENIQETLIVYY